MPSRYKGDAEDLAATRWQALYREYREKQLAWRAHYLAGRQSSPEAVTLHAEMDALRKQMDDIER